MLGLEWQCLDVTSRRRLSASQAVSLPALLLVAAFVVAQAVSKPGIPGEFHTY
jgi:hypothetical protein